MTTVRAIDTAAAAGSDYDPLGEVAAQVLWLSTAMVHHANRVRPNPTGLKVGGHQASSASDVSIIDFAVLRTPEIWRPGVTL